MKLFSAKHLGAKFQAFFLVLMSAAAAFGASGDVDANFKPKLTSNVAGSYFGNAVIQPDGKMIVYGTANTRPFFRRLNVDGSLDPTFDCPECFSLIVGGVAVQPDGKIIVAGTRKAIRVFADGSLDESFNTPTGEPLNDCRLMRPIVRPDGKILITCQGISFPYIDRETIRRLNADGSIDASFTTMVLGTSPNVQTTAQMLLLPDGKILIGGGFINANGGWIQRHQEDGNYDPTFQAAPNARIVGFDLASDGNYLVAGEFSRFNGISTGSVAKLLPNGSLQSGFASSIIAPVSVKALPNGQFYLKILKPNPNFPAPGDPYYHFVRCNANGTVDGSFSQAVINPSILTIDNSNRIVTYKTQLLRLNTDGTPDASLQPAITLDGTVNAGAIQPDGKILVAGEFDKLDGAPAGRLARVNPDGTRDATFNSGGGFDAAPQKLALQTDGKIVVAGAFTAYNGTARARLARINADGSLDAAFAPAVNQPIEAMAIQTDGKILIGGDLTLVNGTAVTGIARLNPDGTLDTTFNTTLVFPNRPTGIVRLIYVQTDGTIIVGGLFSTVNGTNQQSMARLTSSGALAAGPQPVRAGNINQLIQKSDGKYIVSYSNSSLYYDTVARLNNDFSIDYTFLRPTMNAPFTVNTLYEQANGDIIFGGDFSSVNTRRVQNLARIGPSGESDRLFPTIGANHPINQIAGQSDGKIVLFGNFTSVEKVGRTGVARLSPRSRFKTPLFDYDGDARADISVFRPSNGGWYVYNSTFSARFGAAGDRVVPGNYDGDSKTDIGVYRDGYWYSLRSSDGAFSGIQFGVAGDIPVPADYDGDGKDDQAVFRNGSWYLNRSQSGFAAVSFGIAEDKPVAGDYDGDGKADIAVFRPSNGTWYILNSSNGSFTGIEFGQTGDRPVAADYDGDGRTDIAVFRSGNWYILRSSDNGFTAAQFGVAGDIPVPADYDGDSKTDIGVYRDGGWYLMRTTAGFSAVGWGTPTDVPTESAFIP